LCDSAVFGQTCFREMSFAEIRTSDGIFWTQNPEIFVQQCRFRINVFSGNEFPRNRDIRQNVFTETFALMCPKRSNVFSGNEFPRIWDIRQNVFTETFALMCPKRSNVFSGNEFCRNRDIRRNTTWCLFLSWPKGIRCHCKNQYKNKKLKAFETRFNVFQRFYNGNIIPRIQHYRRQRRFSGCFHGQH